MNANGRSYLMRTFLALAALLVFGTACPGVAQPAARAQAAAASTKLHEAAATGNIVMLALLTESTAELEARDEVGLTPFQVAVRNGRLASAALLADKGADVNARDPDGNTLLHQILLHGATVYDRPPTNWLARRSSEPRNEGYLKYLTVGRYEQGPNPLLQTASFLLMCGLDATATNGAGRTAMSLATDPEISERLLLFDGEHSEVLKLLIMGGADVNERDADGYTALHRAGRDILADRVAALLSSMAEITITNRQGRTPLHTFAERIGGWDLRDGTAQPFQLLLKFKPDVNAQDNEGMTPLHVLASSDTSFKKEATHALLQAGANPNLRDKRGRMPAHIFLSGEWPWRDASECIQMLARAGADLSARDGHGRSLVHYLASLGKESPMQSFHGISNAVLKLDLDAPDAAGDTPLHLAAKSGTGDVFNWLVERGANLDATNSAGETPRLLAARSKSRFAQFNRNETDIFQAIRSGNIEAVVALVKADPGMLDRTNTARLTPLRAAVIAHRTNVVEFLEQKGARWDPLSAAMAGRTEILRTVLGENPAAATDAFGASSVLFWASSHDNVEVIRIVLEAGASLHAPNAHGLSALGEALRNRQSDAADYLRRQGANENIFDAVHNGDVATAENLVSRDRSLAHATNRNSVALVEIAAANDDVPVLKLLLDAGARAEFVNARDGRTPLHTAALRNSTNAAELLIGRGAAVAAVDQQGFTALHLAASQGSAKMVALLLKHNADINARVAPPSASSGMFAHAWRMLPGCTPLHLAALRGQADVVELLLKFSADINATNAQGSTALDLTASPAPFSLEIMFSERGFIRTPDPLSGDPAVPRAMLQSRTAARRAVAALLEENGGKRLQVSHPMMHLRPF